MTAKPNKPASASTTQQAVIDILAEIDRLAPDAGTNHELAKLREGIDLLDRAILHLINQRVGYATIIGRIKKAGGIPVYAPNREADVLQNVRNENGGPLSDEAVKRVFERIIDETRSLERRKYQDDHTDSAK